MEIVSYVLIIGGSIMWLWAITEAIAIDDVKLRVFIKRKIQGKYGAKGIETRIQEIERG